MQDPRYESVYHMQHYNSARKDLHILDRFRRATSTIARGSAAAHVMFWLRSVSVTYKRAEIVFYVIKEYFSCKIIFMFLKKSNTKFSKTFCHNNSCLPETIQ